MKFRVRITWSYKPDPEFYPDKDPDKMLETDLISLGEEPDEFVKCAYQEAEDFDYEIIKEKE